MQRILSAEISELRRSRLAAELAPRVIRYAKAGVRQMSLFPIDAQLLVETALVRHGEYFEKLTERQILHPDLVESVIGELGDGVDYATIDARSVNAVYEQLFLALQLRRDLEIFHTDQRLTARILDHLPVEVIPALMSSLPLGNSWQIEQSDALADPTGFSVPPMVWVTIPPWKKRSGRDELAVEFLGRALLADGGLLACILPVSWLIARGHEDSRREIGAKCDVLEVWRLPRDMFNEARFPAAVVFARKRRTPQRSRFAFRWLTAASSGHRSDFLDRGTV